MYSMSTLSKDGILFIYFRLGTESEQMFGQLNLLLVHNLIALEV